MSTIEGWFKPKRAPNKNVRSDGGRYALRPGKPHKARKRATGWYYTDMW